MRKSLFFLFLLTGLVVTIPTSPAYAAVPVISPPTTGSQTFFDDFVSSGFPNQWTASHQIELNNSTQVSGYLVSTVHGNALQSASGYSIKLFGNNVGIPTVQGLKNQSFTELIYKMQAFNLTNPSVTSQANGGNPANDYVIADLQVGLASSASGGFNSVPANGVFFDLAESTSLLSNSCGSATTKQAIYLGINSPMGGANTFYKCPGINSGTFESILYNNGNTFIDLNSMHTYSIQLNKDVNNPTNEYVRYQVDNFGWQTFWQTACSCIGTSASNADLYPFITLTYYVFNVGVGLPAFVISQSVASQIDYVAAYDFQPSSLPAGQLLSSGANPPTKLPNPYPASGSPTGSIPQLIQFEANQFAPGNIYAGGMLLMGLILFIFAVIIGTVMRKMRGGVKQFGFTWSIVALGTSFFFLYCQVVPIWVPVISVILSASVGFGIIRSGSASGGLVPD